MPIERPSDRDFPCFFCGKGKSKDKAAPCPACGRPLDVGFLVKGARVDGYKIRYQVNRGYYGATCNATNRIEKEFAIKLIPKTLYTLHDKSFDDEIIRYRKLDSHPNIADLIDAGEIELTLDGLTIGFYYIVMEWIAGITLTQYLQRGLSNTDEMFGAIFDVLSGLERFEKENLWHNDLNSDNIIFKELSEEERLTRKISSRFICKVVDIGSCIFRQRPEEGRLSDLAFLGHHISDLRKCASAHSAQLSREDQFLLDGLERVVARLLDEDASRGFNNAAELTEALEDIYTRRFLLNEATEVTLSDPFAYLNANDFPNEAFINYLFSARFPWVHDIQAPEAQGTLITGPRGCGKTMILKSMRLKTRLHPFQPNESIGSIQERLERDAQIAFFVSARIEIGNHCSLKKLPAWAQSEELTVYYFLLLFAVEVFDSLHYALMMSVIDIDPRVEAGFCKAISNLLGLRPILDIPATLRQLRLVQNSVVRDVLKEAPTGAVLNSTFLSELAGRLQELSASFVRKSVTFLLDDFATPKVPEQVQRALLPLIWNSGGGYSFRVSSHSESIAFSDLRNNKYEVNREFREINLGAAYLNSVDISRNENAIESYVGDIFIRRFNVSGRFQDQTLATLLGPDYPGPIAAEIKERSENKTLRSFRFFGKNTLIKLCSGDISYLIDMLGQMTRQPTIPITHERQHHVIRQYAWHSLYQLHDEVRPLSCDLFNIALHFGKLSLFKLLKKSVREDGGARPSEYLRIEVALDANVDDVRRVVADLLRNGVFIDGGFSNSSQGIPARKLLFRKIFTPAFPTTYNSRETFSMGAKRFLEFARDPEKFVRATMGEDGITPKEQHDLLSSLADPLAS